MSELIIDFWGVRGTIPTPGARFNRYGGNTSCVSAQCGERWVVFDAGTGLRQFGDAVKPADVDILLSHTHIDHIMGFPFFRSLYMKHAEVRLWAGHLKTGPMADVAPNLRDIMGRLMHPPLFPLVLADLQGNVSFHDFEAGNDPAPEHFSKHGISIRSFLLNHPDNATAYRLEYHGKSVCYVTDVEHAPPLPNRKLAEFIDRCDLFIYDSTFSDATYEDFKGWGHSTWEEGVRLAKMADVKRFAVFHHDPNLDDDALDQRAEALKAVFDRGFVAKEGDKLVL